MTDAISSATGAGAQPSQARASLTTNFDTFLKLLTAQLQNQDPLSPLDANQFTEQLVQYSQVEQQIRTNEQLDSLLSQNAANQTGAALAYLGRVATIESDTTALGATGARWGLGLESTAASASATIVDDSGRAVRTFELGARERTSAVDWDGRMQDGRRAPDGVYRLVVNARDASGETLRPAVTVDETITAVSMGGGDPELVTASGARPFDAIRSIRVAN